MPKSIARRRLDLALGTRIFLLTTLVISFAIGLAILVTSVVGTRIARQGIVRALSSTQSAQAALQQQRYEQLQLIAGIFVADPYLAAYVAEAARAVDTRSMLDLLDSRQSDLGFNFAIVLSPAGKVLARTDQPDSTGQDLSHRALVAEALQEHQASGVWQDGGRLYDAVVVPLAKGRDLLGYLVAGFAIDDARALQVKRISGTEIVFLSAPRDGPPAVVASTLEPAFAARLATALRAPGGALESILKRGEAQQQVEIPLDGHHWIALSTPLRTEAGVPLGATVALASLEEELSTYRQMETVLIVVGLLSMLVALGLSYALSRRTLRPVRDLVAAAEAARQGDYDQSVAIDRTDEVGKLARAFNVLLSNLREKRDMEAYLADLSRSLPDTTRLESPAAPPQRRTAILGLDLGGSDRGPRRDRPLDDVARELQIVTAAVAEHGGWVESAFGQRVLAGFEGEAAALRAVSTVAAVLRTLQGSERPSHDSPLVTAAVGATESGEALGTGDERSLIELLDETSPGQILLSSEAHAELQPALAQTGVQAAEQRATHSPRTYYSLDSDAAARLSVLEASTKVLPRADAAGSVGSSEPAPSGGANSRARVRPAERVRAGAAPRSTESVQLAPGTRVGERFEIVSVLGAGGMGVVYKARDHELDEIVALKMLKREILHDPEAFERLKSELKLARKITHPNVLRTYDFDEVRGVPYISMEYVHGVTLRTLLDQSGRLPYSAGLHLARQLCSGLAAAHAQGVIHRDIKPENLILQQNGNAKLMDFGIARRVKRVAPGQTLPGTVVGTPYYLAPEQLEGGDVDTRADIYAAGVVLYEVFTGKLPFQGGSPMQIIARHLREPPEPPSAHWPEIPQELERIILRCLEKKPEQRYGSIEQLLEDLEALRGEKEPRH